MSTKLFEVEGGYYARLLTLEEDVHDLQRLCEDCLDYYMMVEGEPPLPTEAEGLFEDVPPGLEVDKLQVIGIFNQEDYLVGLLHMVEGYPLENIWFIGLAFIKPEYRGQQLGANMMKACEEWVAPQGVEKIALGVIEVNENAFNFWSKVGFRVAKVHENREYAGQKMKVFYMEKVVKAS